MGKIAGFLELDREDRHYEPAADRLQRRRRLIASAGALLLATVFAAAPAVAKPPPAGIFVQYHFTTASGQPHVVTEPVQIVRADYAAKACGADLRKNAASEARFEVTKYPELAKMTFVSAGCQTDKTGAIRVVGNWPAGQGPRETQAEFNSFAPKVTPALLDGPPAAIVLNYVASNGKPVRTLAGYQAGVPPFYMRTCPAKLQQELPALLKGAQASREQSAAIGNKFPYDISTLKFVSASCIASPKNMGAVFGQKN